VGRQRREVCVLPSAAIGAQNFTCCKGLRLWPSVVSPPYPLPRVFSGMNCPECSGTTPMDRSLKHRNGSLYFLGNGVVSMTHRIGIDEAEQKQEYVRSVAGIEVRREGKYTVHWLSLDGRTVILDDEVKKI